MTTTVLAPRDTGTADPVPQQRRRQRPVGGAVGSAALWVYAIAALTPLVLMVANSFRSTSSLYSEPLSAPWPPNIDSYRRAWTEGHFGEYFLNSLLVTAGAVTLSTVVATMAAYALARTRSRIFSVLESVFVSGLMLPIHLAVLSGVPFSVFVLTTFFRQLPPELEEAARIDGANAWQMFRRIMVPLVRPAVATVVVFRFVPIWNDFLFPLVLLRTREKYTVPVGLTSFFGEYSTDWSALFAGLVIATVPLVVLFLVATRQIVAGLTAGMSK
jgi:raffinose/stachyose/melibiose transport system permease protein